MKKKLVKTSKFLSLVLRHSPETIGITLDEYGWADVMELISAANRKGRDLTRPLIKKVVEDNDKKRFQLSDDGLRIRANQGHSIEVDLGLSPVSPPEFLYHGTATRFLGSIQTHGLIKKNRQHVHLSPDSVTAVKVGQRHGKPVVLVIASGRMHDLGFLFYLSKNAVWLIDEVPPDFIEFP